MSPLVAAPWIRAQAAALLAQRGHAWLLSGPSGLGQYDLALELAGAWLCLQPSSDRACGVCASCHAIRARTHADLFVLMPEVVALQFDWPLGEKAQAELDEKRRKPSKEIRVDAMRDAIEFSQRTSAGGRGKVVLVYPAERMNQVSANALLKTLEEPAGDLKFVLASESAHQLLLTIRSRCLGHAMWWPATEDAIQWIAAQDVAPAAAQAFLRATGGRPGDALQLARSGTDPSAWGRVPKAVKAGDFGPFQDWAPAQTLDTLQKLCHDLQLLLAGAEPRFFAVTDLPPPTRQAVLSQWGRDLMLASRTVEHPFNPGLMREALLSQARNALNSHP